MRFLNAVLAAGVLLASTSALAAADSAPTEVSTAKPRVLVLTDIGNEPDDSESFVRFLLYANEFDIQGLVATTSTWQRDKVQPQLLRERIAAYAKVLPNLRRHAKGYPDAAQLQSLVRSGVVAFGMDGVGDGKDTESSRLIVEAVDASEAPLWITVWGGAADLAQALWHVRATRSPEEVARFVSRLRVYSISDQDYAGPWIRRTFPQLFWIASVHGWSQYPLAAWTGISGDLMRPEKWPDYDLVTNQWLEAHIRRGALGALYPPHKYIMEGDTPSFLALIPNGLNVPEHPEYGGWGGRYTKPDPAAGHYADAIDMYTDAAGKRFSGNQATVFRWRKAFQHDFEARMHWTLADRYAKANHNPVAVVNGAGGLAPVTLTVRGGERIDLDASASTDPDGNALRYRWWNYGEAAGNLFPPPVSIADADKPRAHIMAPKLPQPAAFHIILELTDDGEPALTSYRRVIVNVEPGN